MKIKIMDKGNKTFILKNLIVFVVLLLISFCVIHFDIRIGLTVFENIENVQLFIVIIIKLIIIIIIIVIVLILYYKKINRSDNNG